MAAENKRTDLHNFYQEVGSKYPEEEIVYRDLRGRLRKEFIHFYLEDIKGSFLDLGCNTGIYFDKFNGKLGVGVDVSQSVLLKARNRCQKKADSMQYFFITGDIENLEFLHKIQFDFILCSEVLEHIFNPQKVFDGVARLLKPGGKFLLTTPNYKKEKPTWIPMRGLKDVVSGDEYYHSAFRPEELEKMALSAQHRIVESGTFEWEVKYAAKIPALFFVSVRFFNNRFIRSRKIEKINQKLFEKFTWWIYLICNNTRIEKIFRFFIKEGVRSYILVTR